MRDSVHNIKIVPALAPATYTADATGLTVDRSGFESLTFGIAILGIGLTSPGPKSKGGSGDADPYSDLGI